MTQAISDLDGKLAEIYENPLPAADTARPAPENETAPPEQEIK